MRENGLEALILKEAAKGKLIFGICGGYQMMGETLSDPHGVEAGGTIKGMGLLPMDTVFASKKTRTRVEGSFSQLTGAFAKLSDTALEDMRSIWVRLPEGRCKAIYKYSG